MLLWMVALGCLWFKEPPFGSPPSMNPEIVEKPSQSMSIPVNVHLPTLNNAVGLELSQVPGKSFIEIGLTSIVMNGMSILELQDGEITSADLDGDMVPRIFETASSDVENMKHLHAMTINALEPPSKPKIAALLFVDQQVPSLTIRHVLYSLGQAQISEFYFVVNDPDVQLWEGDNSSEGRLVTVIPTGPTEIAILKVAGERRTGSLGFLVFDDRGITGR